MQLMLTPRRVSTPTSKGAQDGLPFVARQKVGLIVKEQHDLIGAVRELPRVQRKGLAFEGNCGLQFYEPFRTSQTNHVKAGNATSAQTFLAILRIVARLSF